MNLKSALLLLNSLAAYKLNITKGNTLQSKMVLITFGVLEQSLCINSTLPELFPNITLYFFLGGGKCV